MKNERDPRHLVYLLTPTLGNSSSKVSLRRENERKNGKLTLIGSRGDTVDKSGSSPPI